MAEESAFRPALEECDRAIREEVGWSVMEELSASEEKSQLGRIDVVQPTLFAIAVSLARLWQSWGVEPDAVVGHSKGEVAAAHVAGLLTLKDAVKIICRRSKLLRRVSGQGEMGVVELSMEEAQAALRGYEDRLSVAVSNSERSTVLSGDGKALGEVMAKLEKGGVFCRRVKVDVASHSPQMDPLRGGADGGAEGGEGCGGAGADVLDGEEPDRERRGAGRELLGEQPARAGAVRTRGPGGCWRAGTSCSWR
jgi:acyl transferase domain-containing protein